MFNEEQIQETRKIKEKEIENLTETFRTFVKDAKADLNTETII